jgi:shikimate 5-dehydrogenase
MDSGVLSVGKGGTARSIAERIVFHSKSRISIMELSNHELVALQLRTALFREICIASNGFYRQQHQMGGTPTSKAENAIFTVKSRLVEPS